MHEHHRVLLSGILAKGLFRLWFHIGPQRYWNEVTSKPSGTVAASLSCRTVSLCPLAWSEAEECQPPAALAVLPSAPGSCGLHGKPVSFVRRPCRGKNWCWATLRRSPVP